MRKRARQAESGEATARRPAVGASIAARRKALGWTLERLAVRVGCARSYLWMIERGERSAPSLEVLTKIEKALGFNTGELIAAAQLEALPKELRLQVESLRGTELAARRLAQLVKATSLDHLHKSGELKKLVDEVTGETIEAEGPLRDQERLSTSSKKRIKSPTASLRRSVTASLLRSPDIPLINSVAAGYPREFTDLGYPAGIADQYVRVPGLTDPHTFACRVVGDSMLPEYREGDIVVFSPAREVKSGMDCLARLEPDSETTFKRVYVEGEKGRETIRLQPLNPAYPARTLGREQVGGLFAAVSVTRTV